MKDTLTQFSDDLSAWSRGWYLWIRKRLTRYGLRFESHKSVIVDILMARRGTYQRPFLHFSLGILFMAGVTSAPILADSNESRLADIAPPSSVLTGMDMAEYGVETQVSEKPRDQVISYTVQAGDTISTVADTFGVSVDSVKWANDLRSDTLRIGQELKIPPVTGVVHRVKEGETVYSIAKKYKTEAQNIVNFPFNDFADLDTFALTTGQTLIVPGGVVQAPIASAPVRVGPVPVTLGGTGQFQWPAAGSITQYPVWYHMAIDIANSSAPGIAAADSGTVVNVQYLRYGYGYHAVVDHGNGFTTLYAHMQEIYVKPGDTVTRGKVIGRMGSTGRSTGTHLHFEIRKGGALQNPLPYLQ